MEEASELKDEMSLLVAHTQRILVEDCRPWAEFFGPISSPKWTQVDVKKRVAMNASFFMTNYAMVCTACSAFYVLRSPGLLLTLLVCMCMFLYVFMSRRKPIVVMDTTFGTREKSLAAAAASLLLLSVTGYVFALQWSGAMGVILCLLHATFRPPVARAVRGTRGSEPELHGGDDDLEGGGGPGVRGRRGPVNANIRLRTRPGGDGMGTGNYFNSGGVPSHAPLAAPGAVGGSKGHAHGS